MCSIIPYREYMEQWVKDWVKKQRESGKTLAQVSRENEIHPSLVVKWKKEYFRDPGKCLSWQRQREGI